MLLTLLQQVPLEVDREALLQHWPYFYERSIGCVGMLKDWLVRAIAAALADGQSVLTLARLQDVGLFAVHEEARAPQPAGTAGLPCAGYRRRRRRGR